MTQSNRTGRTVDPKTAAHHNPGLSYPAVQRAKQGARTGSEHSDSHKLGHAKHEPSATRKPDNAAPDQRAP